MKRTALLFPLTLISLGSILGYAQKNGPRPIILIDPGHGGLDTGAMGTDLSLEKDMVMDVALNIVQLKKQIGIEGLNVYLTRYSDTLISLYDRGRLTKGLQADLFVSIHGNHASNAKAQGLEVFVWRPFPNTDNPFKEASEALAQELVSELQQKLGLKNRGIKQANFQVLRDNRGQCPAVLVEVGFLSNGGEADYLKSERGVRAMALAILLGISNHLKDAGAH